MRCRHAKKLIFDYIDGVISESDRVGLENHLRECGGCEKAATSLARSLDFLHRVPSAAPSENFNWNLKLRLAREKSAWREAASSLSAWQRAWNARFAVGALSAFVVVLTAGIVFLRSFGGSAGGTAAPEWQPGAIASKNVTVKDERATDRPAYEPFMFQRTRGFGAEPVAMGARAGRDDAAGGERMNGPILNVDSLKAEYTRSTLEDRRIRQLEEQVEVLHKELEKCNPGGR